MKAHEYIPSVDLTKSVTIIYTHISDFKQFLFVLNFVGVREGGSFSLLEIRTYKKMLCTK